VECLVWNVPNYIITGSNTWAERIKNTIVFLWEAFNNGTYKDWGEVSERLYLIHSGRKWSVTSIKDFLNNMYTYLEF